MGEGQGPATLTGQSSLSRLAKIPTRAAPYDECRPSYVKKSQHLTGRSLGRGKPFRIGGGVTLGYLHENSTSGNVLNLATRGTLNSRHALPHRSPSIQLALRTDPVPTQGSVALPVSHGENTVHGALRTSHITKRVLTLQQHNNRACPSDTDLTREVLTPGEAGDHGVPFQSSHFCSTKCHVLIAGHKDHQGLCSIHWLAQSTHF